MYEYVLSQQTIIDMQNAPVVLGLLKLGDMEISLEMKFTASKLL